MTARMLFIHALSPLHAGTGQGVGVIDLPIAREKATGLPYLPGSSLKGVLRSQCSDEQVCVKIFGPDTSNADDHAGSAQFSDQRLLLLPIRSLKGTFAWVTSPYLLQRLIRDGQHTTSEAALPKGIPPMPAVVDECVTVSSQCAIRMSVNNQDKVVLEELDLTPAVDKNADEWADWLAEQIFPDDESWQAMLKGRICIVHDDTLNFLLQTATEVTARIKLQNDTKTVEKGGLWYEEALPTETILSGLVVATPVKKTKMTMDEIYTAIGNMLDKPLQFGGNATVGRGICQVRLA